MYQILAVTLLEFLQRPNVLIALVLAVIGIALSILARRIVCACKKTKQLPDNDSALVAVKIVGLVLILVGFILMIIEF